MTDADPSFVGKVLSEWELDRCEANSLFPLCYRDDFEGFFDWRSILEYRRIDEFCDVLARERDPIEATRVRQCDWTATKSTRASPHHISSNRAACRGEFYDPRERADGEKELGYERAFQREIFTRTCVLYVWRGSETADRWAWEDLQWCLAPPWVNFIEHRNGFLHENYATTYRKSRRSLTLLLESPLDYHPCNYSESRHQTAHDSKALRCQNFAVCTSAARRATSRRTNVEWQKEDYGFTLRNRKQRR